MTKLIFAAALLFASFSAAAGPIAGLVNTGVGAANTADAHYTVTKFGSSTNDGWTTDNGDYPLTTMFGFHVGPWRADNATSKWLTPTADQSQSFDPFRAGVYTWHMEFDLTGFDFDSASFMARMLVDDSAVIKLNGQIIGNANSSSTWSNFGASSGFIDGINSLDFLVTNNPLLFLNPTGLRVEFLSSDVDIAEVPEPGSIALLFLGLGMMGAVARRRRSA